MGVWSDIWDAEKYLFNQVYAGLETIDYGILWQLAKSGYMVDDPKEIDAFISRFNEQWFIDIPQRVVSMSENINPLAKIIKIAVTQFLRYHSKDDLAAVVTVYGGRSIKLLTERTAIGIILSSIVRKISTAQAIRKSTQIGISAVSWGLSIAATEQGMEMRSFEAARDLKAIKPHFYHLLYQANVETFYFLVEKDLSPITRKL